MSTSVTAELAPDPALALDRGLAVFGLPPGAKRPAPGWHRHVSSDPATVAALWTPGDNVGIGCRASGVVGIDLDRHPGEPDGVEAFGETCERHRQPWPNTLTVRTPTGDGDRGKHLVFWVPPRRIIGSTSGGVTPLGPGIDTRGPGRHTGGHLVGPGSIVHGVRYKIEHDTAIIELPRWIADLLDPPQSGRTLPRTSREEQR